MKLIGKTNFDFVGSRHSFLIFSGVLMLLSVVAFIARKGPNLGIDFTGGVVIQVKFEKMPDLAAVRNIFLEEKIQNVELQSIPAANSIIIRMKGNTEETFKISERVNEMFNKRQLVHTIERNEYVGPRIGKYLATRALYAIILSWLGIIVYVAFRFRSTIWGMSGVIALVHDTWITFGLFLLLNYEIDLTVVAAFLTLIGYSINDTIVVFDRIRENLKLMRKDPLNKIMNISINQTLSRTIITSLTVEIVALFLFIFGGPIIHNFALGMTFGTIIGTYSSVFIASPIVYDWTMSREARRHSK